MVTKGDGCLAPILGGARHNRLCVFPTDMMIFQDNVQNTRGLVEKMKTGKKKKILKEIFLQWATWFHSVPFN